MNKAKAIEAVLKILHLDELSRSDNGYGGITSVASSPLFSKQIKIYNLNPIVLAIEMGCGYKVYVDSNSTKEDVLKEIINFIAENTKIFFFEPKILNWGFNCNLSFVDNLYEALSE